jgi:hypothetical protein
LQRLTLLRTDSRTLIPDVIAIGGGHNGRPPRRIRPRRAESRRAQTPLSCWRRGRHGGILSLLPQLCRRYTVSLLNRRSFAISSFIATGRASSRVLIELPAPPDGHHLIVAPGGTEGEIAKFSDRDATGLTPTRRGSSARPMCCARLRLRPRSTWLWDRGSRQSRTLFETAQVATACVRSDSKGRAIASSSARLAPISPHGSRPTRLRHPSSSMESSEPTRALCPAATCFPSLLRRGEWRKGGWGHPIGGIGGNHPGDAALLGRARGRHPHKLRGQRNSDREARLPPSGIRTRRRTVRAMPGNRLREKGSRPLALAAAAPQAAAFLHPGERYHAEHERQAEEPRGERS